MKLEVTWPGDKPLEFPWLYEDRNHDRVVLIGRNREVTKPYTVRHIDGGSSDVSPTISEKDLNMFYTRIPIGSTITIK